MSNSQPKTPESGPLSRRDFIVGSGAGVAAAATISSVSAPIGLKLNKGNVPNAPFDSVRDYIAAMDAQGLVRYFDAIDQDAYEGTAIMYRLIDRFGILEAPIVVFNKVKIGGRWMEGPVIANRLRHLHAEAILFGLDPSDRDPVESYHNAFEHLTEILNKNRGNYPTIDPIIVDRGDAPCKEVVIEENDINILDFPFFRNNPAEPDRFINTASVFTTDPEQGLNFGTYRCQIKGPRHISVGSGDGQTGYNMLMAAKARGERYVPLTMVVGQDPIVWLISGSRVANRRGKKPVNELALAGGLRGKALEVIKSETNEFMVPAHAEMVIEGTIDLNIPDPNGPYAEGSGYVGAVYEEAFFMNVTRVTHREKPWIVNDFTGVSRPMIEAPSTALETWTMKKIFPAVTGYRYVDSVVYIKVKKTKPGEALDIGKRLASIVPVFKIIVMVDDDIDLMKANETFAAFSTRWQPYPASHIFSEMMETMPLEPSAPARGETSKMVIDATRQMPEEGGPENFPAYSRNVFTEANPDIFEYVDKKWAVEIFDV
ncbi:MAG: UbiD family decarboxylase [Pseudomonadota bacterium]|nr:UbiD family decarboxylase [Pseudomonadota bacterium]